jgi:hypothetical protein
MVGSLFTYDNSQTTMSSGSVNNLTTQNSSQVTMLDALVERDLCTYDSSQVTMSGGVVDWNLIVHDSSLVNWSGGTIGLSLLLDGTTATLTVDGSDFAIDGTLFGFGEINSILGGAYESEPFRRLTGTLANGDIINNQFRIGETAKIVLVPEPTTPPVADADGPYSIFVGDTLTLDANGSTDDDNDMVSYMWDLDDNSSFETDAGGQAIFDVNYTYLQSLGLLVDLTYKIHLKVTDSEGQSDVNDTTLTIIPKPALVVAVDIKPGGCPNPVNVKSSGVLPVAILGTGDCDVTTIVPTSVRLAGVEPLRNSLEDVATPVSDVNDCNCTEDGPDGLLDLTLKFETQEIVEAIGDVNNGDVVTLELTGVLYDPIPYETPIEGADCIVIKGKHRAFNKADINKDSVVDGIDFAIIAENWLRSIIVEE